MAAAAAPAAAKKPALVVLELEYTEGGSSPWFNSRARSFVASLSSGPVTADLFRALARDGSMGTLVGYIDSESSSVSSVTSVCYALLGLVLLVVLLLLPLAVLGLRRYAAAVGFIPWLFCDLLMLTFGGIQLTCLLTMMSTWQGMVDGLNDKMPLAYEWTFQMLRNYTALTVQMLKEAGGGNTELDRSLEATSAGIKWLRGNISQWEDKFSGYAGLKTLLTGIASIIHMALLGFALAAAVASALVACGAWSRRTDSLAKGRKSPTFVALAAIVATVLLFGHLGVALLMITRWLPVCVLAETYLCAPYRDGSYSVIDDSVRMIWPPSNRPEPFCRLVPSTLLKKCAAKGKTPLKKLPVCQKPKETGKVMIVMPDDAVIEFQASQPPQKPQAVIPAAGSSDKKVVGDCFYPQKVIRTDMTSMCPLVTDELLAHWMAMVLSVPFGFVTAFAAAAVGIIFMAVGEPKKKSIRRPLRKKRIRSSRKRKSKPKKSRRKPTPPSTVPSRSETSVQTERTPSGQGRLSVVLAEPFPVPIPKRRKRRSQPVMLMPAPPSQLPIPIPVPVPVPVMQPLSPFTQADSQDAPLSSRNTAPTVVPTSRSDVSPLSDVGYGSIRGYPHCACGVKGAACTERARSMHHSGYPSWTSPQPDYSCVTAPRCRHLAPVYTITHTPLCNRMRGVSPTAVEVAPARHMMESTGERACRPPWGSSKSEKAQL